MKLFNNLYFAAALADHHGDDVAVGYDLHDPATVVVRMLDGRMICQAEWHGNSRDYVPVSFLERQKERRLQGRLKRLDTHRTEALEEAGPTLALAPAPAQPSPREEAALAALEAELAAQPAPAPDPEQEKQARFRRALAIEEFGGGGDDRDWLSWYARSAEYRAMRMLHEEFGDSIFE